MFHQKNVSQVWVKEDLKPFDQMMLTWNAKRPVTGDYQFLIRAKVEGIWSKWLLYATWGKGQRGSSCQDEMVRVYQDAIEVLRGKKATGFQVKIEGDAPIKNVYGLHVYTNAKEPYKPQELTKSVFLDVPGLSQMKLDHPKANALCSPTSCAAVVRYLLKNSSLCPLEFANSARDGTFNIFGNWVLNVAQAASLLGPDWDCFVEHLQGFGDIYRLLEQGSPVVVSVRGPLEGSAQPYARGHLLVVIGYDAAKKRVLCMDPAFASDNKTHVSYPLDNFVGAWERRHKVAYIFTKL